MNCQSCGKPLVPGARFCSSCGTPAAADALAAKPTEFHVIGDVIEEVNRRPVRSVEELRAALRTASGRPALVLVNRGGDSLYLTLTPRA